MGPIGRSRRLPAYVLLRARAALSEAAHPGNRRRVAGGGVASRASRPRFSGTWVRVPHSDLPDAGIEFPTTQRSGSDDTLTSRFRPLASFRS